MSRKRINLIKGPSVGKSLTTSGKKGTVAKKARFSFDPHTNGTNGKAKAANGHTTTNGHHPVVTAAVSHTALQVSRRER